MPDPDLLPVWELWKPPLPTGLAQIHVWRAWAGEAAALCCRPLLSPHELRRADRFLNPAAVHEFVVARGLLRRVLSTLTGLPPRALRLEEAPGGKPFLAEPPGLEFNLTHAAGLILLALASASVGVDAARLDPLVDQRSIAAHFFHPLELDLLDRLPSAEYLPAFYRIWTRKEALLKAVGVGLVGGLRSFAVSPDSAAYPRCLAWTSAWAVPAAWPAVSFCPAPGWQAALVCASPFAALHFWDFDLTRDLDH